MIDKPYYSKKVIEHFMNPKNMGEIKGANGIGDTQNLRCGDVMKIYLKIETKGKKEIIKDAKFQTMGCGHAIAISDMICEIIKGKTLEESLKVGYEDIKAEIGPVPSVKIHCAALAQAGVKAAIENYKSNK
jgi:nitrogen fixation NifU-like protein